MGGCGWAVHICELFGPRCSCMWSHFLLTSWLFAASAVESPNPRRRAAPPRRGIRSRDLRRWPGQARASLKLRTSLRLRWLQSFSAEQLQLAKWRLEHGGDHSRRVRGPGASGAEVSSQLGTLLGRPFYDDPKFVKLQPEQMRSPSRCVEPKQSKDVS